MRFVSRSIESAALVVLLVVCGLGALSVPTSAHASGSLPAGCSMHDGIILCGDGSVGDTGSVCITDNATGEQSCLTGVGGLGSGPSGKLGTGLGHVLGTPSQVTGTGWLSRITGWLSYALNTLFAAFVQFFKDLVTYALATVLGVVALAISLIPIPDWISDNSMGGLLGQAGPVAGFFMSKLQIPAALGLIGAGYAFRLIRKFCTLFQW